MRWQEAMDFAARSNASVPSREELNQMYQARDEGALKGTFNTTGSHPAGWYWSSSQYGRLQRVDAALQRRAPVQQRLQERRVVAALCSEMNHLII